MLYVISQSLDQGRATGIASALGIGAGTLVHTMIAAVGLSALLISIPLAFNIIRYAGALYLAYLGIKMILVKTRKDQSVEPVSDEVCLRDAFRRGVTTNVLNPKVALFFLAFLPQFVVRSEGGIMTQFVMLGLLFDTSGTSVNIIVALIAGRAGMSIREHSLLNRIQKILPATILIGLAVLIVLS